MKSEHYIRGKRINKEARDEDGSKLRLLKIGRLPSVTNAADYLIEEIMVGHDPFSSRPRISLPLSYPQVRNLHAVRAISHPNTPIIHYFTFITNAIHRPKPNIPTPLTYTRVRKLRPYHTKSPKQIYLSIERNPSLAILCHATGPY